MHTYLYRRGDGNDGNFPQFLVTLSDEQNPYAALAALVVSDFKIGHATRRYVIKHIETDGEPDYGISAWVHEGPKGEQAFGAAWITAELQPVGADDAEHYSGRYSTHTLREALDSAAWRFYRREVAK